MERVAIEDGHRGPTRWTPARVTVRLGTAGIASWTAGEADAGQLVARADAALLQAKRAGRNRVVHECAPSQALLG